MEVSKSEFSKILGFILGFLMFAAIAAAIIMPIDWFIVSGKEANLGFWLNESVLILASTARFFLLEDRKKSFLLFGIALIVAFFVAVAFAPIGAAAEVIDKIRSWGAVSLLAGLIMVCIHQVFLKPQTNHTDDDFQYHR